MSILRLAASAIGRNVNLSPTDWANVASSVTYPSLTYNASKTIAGLGSGVSVTLRITASVGGIGGTGGSVYNAVIAYDKNSGGPIDMRDDLVLYAGYVDITVTNGDTLRFGVCDSDTTALTGTITITNQSTGAVVDTFTIT